MPQYFAITPRRDWRIRRGEIEDDGTRVYTFEQWVRNEKLSEIHFRAKFLLQMVEKAEELMGIAIWLHQVFGGTMLRICGQNGIPADDTRTYEQYLADERLAA